MKLTRYGFSGCIGAFFQMATSDAKQILPNHLQPVEAQHERSVMAVLAFRFDESEVGAYDELVMAIITPPRVEPGAPLPRAAFFPFVVATSTPEARQHGMDRWCLPHYMADLDFAFVESDQTMNLSITEEGRPVLDLRVTSHEFRPVTNPYHCFTAGESVGRDGKFKVNIFMDGPHCEHEFEEGELVLHEHPMTEMLTLEEVATYPFREEWYRTGVQTFEELEEI